MIIFIVYFLYLICQVYAHSRSIVERAICNVHSTNDTLVDDAQTSSRHFNNAATRALFSHSTPDIQHALTPGSVCLLLCNFRIEGTLSISSDWDYWSKQEAAITISGASNLVVSQQDKLGFIEADNFGWARTPGMPVPDKMPTLFSIGGGSSEIYFQDIQITRAPGTVFHVHFGSSAIQSQNSTTEGQSTIGYLIEDAQNVYIWTGRVQSTDACVKIAPNVMNVQVESVTCVGVASEQSRASGIELQLSGKDGLSWIPNVWVNQFDGIDKLNVVAFPADEGSAHTQSVEVTNATFKDMTFGQSSGRREPAVHAVLMHPNHPPLTALDITFSDVNGTEQYATDLTCGGERDGCSFTQEKWSVVVANVTVND